MSTYDNSSGTLDRDDLEKEIYRLKRFMYVHERDGYLENLESWILNRKSAQNTRTDIIIWIMGVLLVWAVAVGRPESFVGDLAGIFLTTGTIAVMLIIRDQKLNHSHTFSTLAYSSQQPLFDVFGAFFVPNKHLDYLEEGTFKNQPCISEQGGKLVPAEYASGEAGIIRWIMLAISIIVFSISVLGIVSKHYAFI
ncbi:MAG: hypothetical protein U5L06_06645 [Rhodovibrio sp.]|nr:hypothetical protein [Rhodovibrio sp.]